MRADGMNMHHQWRTHQIIIECNYSYFVPLGATYFKYGSKWVQIHITCPLWIHRRLIPMSFSKHVHQIHGSGQKLSQENCHAFCVGWASSSWLLFCVCLGWKKDPNESSYTSHVQYESIQDSYWWVSANTVHQIHESGQWPKNCLNKIAMLSVQS